jgi:hypothetical protein
LSAQSQQDQIVAELEERSPELASKLVPLLNQVDADVRLMSVLQHEAKYEQPHYRVWELVALHLLNSGRVRGALGLYWGLYEHMLDAQSEAGRISKGTPLVRISDCFAQLGFRVHAKRYLMLTLCEDALDGDGTISPETTGVYFRLAWIHGLPHEEISKYANEFARLAIEYPKECLYPEALLQRVDNAWLTELPAAEEASFYRISSHYARYRLRNLGDRGGKELELLAEYIMSCLPGCRTQRRTVNRTSEYDMICTMEGLEVDFRSELGRYFICECKDWKKPANFSNMAKFCRILDSIRARFAIFFSKNGITKPARAEQMKVYQNRGIVVIILGLHDLQSIASGVNLITLLRSQYEDVRLELRRPRA